MGILDTPAYSRAAADAKFAGKKAVSAAGLFNRLGPIGADPFPAVHPSPPTITWASAATINARAIAPQSGEVTILGQRGTFDPATGKTNMSGEFTGLDFYLYGDAVEIAWTETVINGSTFWFWVDGKPVTAQATAPGLTTAAGTAYYTKLAFPSVARYRVTLYTAGLSAMNNVRIAATHALTATPPMPTVAFVGDSFFGGSGGSPMLSASAITMARLLGVNPINASTGGTGYLAGSQTFGSVARRGRLAGTNPELIIFSGSVNDGTAGLEAAATATFASYATDFPGVPCIVFGPQPSNAADTISAGRATAIAAVKAAALAAPNVVAFHDMVGTNSGTAPAAWSGGTTYSDGALVSYKGSIYQLKNGGSTSLNADPGVSLRWTLITYMYTGTGKVGTVVGDGSRDTLLNADGVHPQVEGSTALAIVQSAVVRKDLSALVVA